MSNFKDKIRLSLMETKAPTYTQEEVEEWVERNVENKKSQLKLTYEDYNGWTLELTPNSYLRFMLRDDTVKLHTLALYNPYINISCPLGKNTNATKILNLILNAADYTKTFGKKIDLYGVDVTGFDFSGFHKESHLRFYNCNVEGIKLNTNCLELKFNNCVGQPRFDKNIIWELTIELTQESTQPNLSKIKSVDNLYMYNSYLTKIENLPQKVESLGLSGNNISKIENLPKGLKVLNLIHNDISVVENIPSTVTRLLLRRNNVSRFKDFTWTKKMTVELDKNDIHNFKGVTFVGVSPSKISYATEGNPIQSFKGVSEIKKFKEIFTDDEKTEAFYNNIDTESLIEDIENFRKKISIFKKYKNYADFNDTDVLNIKNFVISFLENNISYSDEIKESLDKFYEICNNILPEFNDLNRNHNTIRQAYNFIFFMKT